MSAMVETCVEDRLRLAGVLLAAGDWPEREQAAKAYKPHRTAEAARRVFAAHAGDPAVTGASAIVGDGAGLGTLYAHAFDQDWPGDLGASIAAFRTAAPLDAFLADTEPDWQQAEADLKAVLARANLGEFLAGLFGSESEQLTVYPNLLFPGQQPVTIASGRQIVVCAPPPLAWGTSPPWRYSERPDEVLAKLAESFARFLFVACLPPDQAALAPKAEVFALAAAVVFLRRAEGQAAGDQFMVMEKKTRGLRTLPAAVAALDEGLATGPAGLGELLPRLAGSL